MSAVLITAITFGALLLMDIGCWAGVARAPQGSVRRSQIGLVSSALLVAVAVWAWALIAAMSAR